MLIALILIFMGIFCILFVLGREPIPWTYRLRRIHAGVSHKAEWIAPDDVVRQVSSDYLSAVGWCNNRRTDALRASISDGAVFNAFPNDHQLS